MTIKLVTEPEQENAKVVAALEKALAQAKKGELRECVIVVGNGEEIHTWWQGSTLRLLALTARATHILNRRTDQETGKG